MDMQKLKDKSSALPAIPNKSLERRRSGEEEWRPKHIQTIDKKIKIIGQEKPSNAGKEIGYFYPESIGVKVGQMEEKRPDSIPNAFERRKIRDDIKIILDHNFNIELNNKKKAKPGKLAPMDDDMTIPKDKDQPPPANEGIIKFLDKDFVDQEARGKYDRRVYRRRSQLKAEGKKIITESDVKEEERRDQQRKNNRLKKDPGMVDMVQEIPNDRATAEWDKAFYLDNKPLNPKKEYDPGAEDDGVYRRKKRTNEKFYVIVYIERNGPDGIGWRSYQYDLFVESAQLIDLKIMVEKDLGYSYHNQHYYFNLRKIDDNTDLRHLDFKCDLWSRDCMALVLIPDEEPIFNRDSNPRGKYLPIPVTEYFPENGPFAKTTAEFLGWNTLKSLLYPPNRDWTVEFYQNYNQVKILLAEIKQKDKMVTAKKYLGPRQSDNLTRLAIHTKGMQKTLNEFEETAIKCVEIINKWDVKPHELNFLYGVGGHKYVMGGIVIKECKFIYTLNRKVEEIEIIGDMVKHKVEMMNWIRSRTDDFIVPLTTVIEYFGRYYVAYAAVPIDLNSLVYGSITQNLLIVNDLNDHKPMQELARILNLNFHYVYESGLDNYKPIYVTSNWEIHRVKDKLYITDIDRILPLDFCEESEINLDSGFITNFLTMEVVQSSVSRTIDDAYSPVKSRDTFRCSECNEFIPDIEYYTHDRGNTSATDGLGEGYNCCVSDYRKKSVYHQLKISVGKLKRKKFRAISLGDFYVNNVTGEILDQVPYQKVPLNADIIEDKDRPGEIINQIKNDEKNIGYLSNRLRGTKCQEVAESFQRFESDIGTCKSIELVMKEKGMPIRYLGKIAENCDKNFVKELIIREMVARAMAHILRGSFEYLRKLANEMKEFNLKKNLAFHLNNLMGNTNSEDSKVEWKHISDYVRIIFDTILEIGVKDKIHLPGLLIRILELIDAKLLVNIEDIDFLEERPFKVSYFEIYHPRIEISLDSMFVYDFFTDLARFYQKIGRYDSWWITTGDEIEASIFYHNQAANMVFGEADVRTSPYLFNLAQAAELKHQEKGRPEFSSWNRSAKIADDKHSSVARYNFNKIVSICAENVDKGSYTETVRRCDDC